MAVVILRVDTQNGRTYKISRAEIVRLYPHLASSVRKLTHKGDYTEEGKGTDDKFYQNDGLRYITRITPSGSTKRRVRTRSSPLSEYDLISGARMQAAVRLDGPIKRKRKARR